MASYFEIDYKSEDSELSMVKREQSPVDVYQFLRLRKPSNFVVFLMEGFLSTPQIDDEVIGVWEGEDFISEYDTNPQDFNHD